MYSTKVIVTLGVIQLIASILNIPVLYFEKTITITSILIIIFSAISYQEHVREIRNHICETEQTKTKSTKTKKKPQVTTPQSAEQDQSAKTAPVDPPVTPKRTRPINETIRKIASRATNKPSSTQPPQNTRNPKTQTIDLSEYNNITYDRLLSIKNQIATD